jgi:hypothetical protein
MVGRGHTKETVELLNVNSIHLNTLFDGRSWHTKETVGLLNVNSIHLNTLFDGRSWSYQRNRCVVKCKLYTFKYPLRW